MKDNDPYNYEEKECPTCGVMAPASQIENHGQCERHIIEEYNENKNDDEVNHGISIIEREWRPKAAEEKNKKKAVEVEN